MATGQILGSITQTKTFTRTHCSRKRLQGNLLIYLSIYQRCSQITSKAHEYTNRFKLGRSIKIGQKVFLENHTKVETITCWPFYSHKTNNEHYVRNSTEYANPDNINVTHRNHPIEYFPKDESLPALITNYAPIAKDSEFFKHLVQSQTESYNSNQQKGSFDVMRFIISPLRDTSENFQQISKSNATLSPNVDSGIQSPATPTNDDHNYQNVTISPLPPLHTPILPLTSMPIRVPTILRTPPQFHETEQSSSSSLK